MDRIGYAAYKRDVASFYKRENIVGLSSAEDSDTYHVKSPCDCCGRPELGNRELAIGIPELGGAVCTYAVCLDCIYYAEHGKLDDRTMEEIATEEVPPVSVNGGSVNYNLVPTAYMTEVVRGYIERGEYPGGFLLAVISNDLFGAYHRADHVNTLAMHAWVSWFYRHTPASCFGSMEHVEAWCKWRKGEIE